MRAWIIAGAFLALLGQPAQAAVESTSEDSFKLTFSTTFAKPAVEVFAQVGQIGRWWSSDHTYSGSASNMEMALEAGGCFCEAWDGNSIEHGRVLLAWRGRLLRLSAALGPLQELGVTGILTFAFEEADGRTTLTMTYLVNGPPGADLAHIAPLVDSVLGEQFARLAHYAETGAAD